MFTLQPGSAFQGYWPMLHGDLDGDGDEDLIGGLANGLNGSVHSLAVLQQVGAHQFAVNVFSLGSGVGSLDNVPVLADLDGDGDLDVAVDDGQLGTTLHVYANQGGVFSLAATIPFTGQFGRSTAIAGDVDGDGRTDLALANESELRVFRRNGPGLTYDAPRRFSTDGTRALLDVDQDGDLDAVGRSTSLGSRFHGPGAGMRRQYGLALAGAGGRRPVLGCAGPIRGGLTPVLRLRQAVGGALSLLVLGGAETATPSPVFPELTHYTLPILGMATFVLPGAVGQPGAGALDMPLTIPPVFGGTRVFFQQFVFDAAAPNGILHSNGLEFAIGN
jgi:hypothetical protein